MALRNQLMLGGHLGTCLLELGCVDEGRLGRTLAEVHGVPYARPEAFSRIRPEVLKRLPRKAVEEHNAIPLEQRGRRLVVAMVNPRNLAACDALGFASGCEIIPWVAPEVRIFEAMEKYYAVPRRLRYVVLARDESHWGASGARVAEAQARPTAVRPDAAEKLAEPEPAYSTADDPSFDDHRPWTEIASELYPHDPSTRSETRDARPTSVLERTAELLCSANDPEAVAGAVLDAAAATLARVALFAVKGEELRLWTSRGLGPGAEGKGVAPFSVTSHGILDHLQGEDHYRGALGSDPRSLRFYEWLAIAPPAEILLVPVHLNDRLVAVMYGDGGVQGNVGGETGTYLRLGRMLGLALTALIYKGKIRGLGTLTAEPRS
jgi:hypothetical protein